MKQILGFFLVLSLVSCQHLTSPTENQSAHPVQLRTNVYPIPDSSFTVKNDTHDNIGTVSILLTDSTTVNINVTDSGSFSTPLSKATVSCLIKGQPLPYSTATWIKITDHLSVRATWTSDVIIVDTDEQN